MRKMLLALLGVATLVLFGANQALAGQPFCYNTKTGEFLHWCATITAQAASAARSAGKQTRNSENRYGSGTGKKGFASLADRLSKRRGWFL
jgi:hypothetical protein